MSKPKWGQKPEDSRLNTVKLARDEWMRRALAAELRWQKAETALDEWLDKTRCVKPLADELGLHKIDVMLARFKAASEALELALKFVAAGGATTVEINRICRATRRLENQ